MVELIFPVKARGISVKRRGKRLLGPLDLVLDRAGVTVVMGPNGAGKTTLLRALHGLERLASGSVTWHSPPPVARKRQAYVFQTPILLRRSVEGNLRYPLTLLGTSVVQMDAAVSHWLDRIALAHARKRPAHLLSGGERQKLALARALITQPQALFLDEPCTNLDGQATKDIETLLGQAAAKGTRIMLATHDLGQARRLATEVVFLINGKLHEQGAAPQVFDTPATPELRAFLAGEIVT